MDYKLEERIAITARCFPFYCGLLFIIIHGHLCQGNNGCAPTCQCRGSTVNCNGSGIPTQFPSRTTHVKFSGCSIRRVFSGSFDGVSLPRIESIDLSDCLIESIDGGGFINLHLTEIILKGNSLSELQFGAFVNVTCKRLDLTDNVQLQQIADDSFVDSHIESLYLTRCNISHLNATTFDRLSGSLRILHLSHNAVALSLPSGMFFNYTLTELDLSHNKLTVDDLGSLNGAHVDLLDISDNCIGNEIWRVVQEVRRVSSLVLGSVCLDTVNITRDIHLGSLGLEGNYLRNVYAYQFIYAGELVSLVLKRNHLRVFPSDIASQLHQLSIVDLSFNELEIIRMSDLEVFPNLKSVDLSGNKIESIPVELEPLVKTFSFFSVEDNPLHCNCELRWLYEWVKSIPFGSTVVEVGLCGYPKEEFLLMEREDFLCFITNVTISGSEDGVICATNSSPSADLTMYREGLLQTVDMNRNIIQTTINLTFSPCSEGGEFVCIASNSVGNVSAKAHIHRNAPAACITSEQTPSRGGDMAPVTQNVPSNPATHQETSSTRATDQSPSDVANDVTTPADENETKGYIVPLAAGLGAFVILVLLVALAVWSRIKWKKYQVRKKSAPKKEPLESFNLSRDAVKS